MKIKKGTIAILSAVFLAAVFSMALFLNIYFGKSLIADNGEKIKITFQAALQNSSSMDARRESVESTFDIDYFHRADTVSYMLNNLNTGETRQQVLSRYRTLLNLDNIVIIDGEGNITDFALNSKTDFADPAFQSITDLLSSGTERKVVEAASGDAVYRYYASVIDNEHIAVAAVNRRELDSLTAPFVGWKAKLAGITPGKSGYLFAVSSDSGKILYHPDESFIGKDNSQLIQESDILSDGFSGTAIIKGVKCRVSVKESGDAFIIACVPFSGIFSSYYVLDALVLLVFTSFLIIMVIYALGIHEAEIEDEVLSEGQARARSFFSRRVFSGIFLYLVLGTAATAVVFYYALTLIRLGDQSVTNKTGLSTVEYIIGRNNTEKQLFEDAASRNVLIKAQSAAYILESDPECRNFPELRELSGVLGASDITLYNSRGAVSASSSAASSAAFGGSSGSMSEKLKKIYAGADSYVTSPEYDEISGKLTVKGLAAVKDEEGNVIGLVSVSYEPFQLEKTMSQSSISTVLGNIWKWVIGEFMAVSIDDRTVTFSTVRKMIGQPFDEELFSGFSGFVFISGEKHFADCIAADDSYIICSLPTERILKNTVGYTAAVSAFTAFVFLICALILSFRAAGEDKAGAEHILEFILPDGSIKRRISGSGKTSRWSEKSPAQKASSAAKAMLLLLCTVITVLYLSKNRFIRSDSILSYIFDGNWKKGLNIFAVTGALVNVSVFVVIKQVIHFLLELLASNSDARTETISRLMISFLKYITALLCVYFCLAKFGVDTDTLLASAGILSLIIGLGAQDLIKDILAGLFIIFEEEFKVGDIVMVDGFTGTVREIGIRATKIEDIGQNIKVINNSQISGILNKTQKYSYAVVDVGIEYSESLERVEEVLGKELPEVKKRLPDIISGPVYRGVTELGDSAVVLRIVATCTEGKRILLTNALNREIKLIFDRNGINIPFNQLVIHKED